MLKPPVPGLRRLTHDSNQAEKVTLTIPAGDTLEVSADVAGQLEATSTHFKADKPAPAPKAAPVKAAAKKAAPKASE